MDPTPRRKRGKAGKAGFAKFLLRNAGAEAAEEGAADLFNWIADDLYDLVTGTKESEFKQFVSAYEENGLDRKKVLLSAIGDRAKELGLDTLGGALSGLFLSGAKSGFTAVQLNRWGKEAFDAGSYRQYVSYGLNADPNTEAYRYAAEIQAKRKAGREFTNIEMGQLTAAVYAEALGVGEQRTEKAPEATEDSIWDGVFCLRSLIPTANGYFDRKLTDAENGSIVESSRYQAPGTMSYTEFTIQHSLGAKAKNYLVFDPISQKQYPFVEGTRIMNPTVFAGKGGVNPLREEVAQGLSEQIGGKPKEWQHCKGTGTLNCDGEEREAEVHWFQEPSVGKHRFKVKKWLDD